MNEQIAGSIICVLFFVVVLTIPWWVPRMFGIRYHDQKKPHE